MTRELPENPNALRIMPLHAITQVYGEQGLHARFTQETERFESWQRDQLLAARELALLVHKDQGRDTEPYSNHLHRVAIRVIAPTHYGVDDYQLGIAAVLHDSVEDHWRTLPQLAGSTVLSKAVALNYLGDRFGTEVKTVVAAVTNPDFDTAGDWRADYRRHVADSMRAVPGARVIKMSDFTDNGVGVLYSRAERLQHFSEKYQGLIPIFRELIPLPDTPLSPRAKRLVLEQLDLAETRFAAILG